MISAKTLQKEEVLVITYQQTKCNKAFGKLYEMFYPQLFDYIGKISKNTDDAFDITQEAFIIAAKEIDSLKVPVTFRFWLFRIAKNLCMKSFRKQAKENSEEYAEDWVAQNYDISEAQEREEQLEKLTLILTQLPSDDQQLLLNKYALGKSIKELMEENDLGSSAVKMKLKRARAKILDHMIST